MSNSKLGTFVLLGALIGAGVSMFDRSTRNELAVNSRVLMEKAKYYKNNPDELKSKLNEKKDKYQSIYTQLSGDATFLKSQVEELKTLTPQVKELVEDSKQAFAESKDEYKEIAKEEGV